MTWEIITTPDYAALNAIADSIHPTLPEKPEIFNDRISQYPEGCRKLVSDRVYGYGISHPYTLGNIPSLDKYLAIPDKPNCIYIHDIAILPEGRGGGSLSYLKLVVALARESGITNLALTAVYGSDKLWERYGFRDQKTPVVGYGDAKYMVLDIEYQEGLHGEIFSPPAGPSK